MKLKHISMVCEFPYVFTEQLPRLPPQWEIDFKIELAPSAQPISKALYRRTLIELKELKIQIDELL